MLSLKKITKMVHSCRVVPGFFVTRWSNSRLEFESEKQSLPTYSATIKSVLEHDIHLKYLKNTQDDMNME